MSFETTYGKSMDIACPSCGAKAGSTCVTKQGKVSTTAHAARLLAIGTNTVEHRKTMSTGKKKKAHPRIRSLCNKVRNYVCNHNMTIAQFADDAGVSRRIARRIVYGNVTTLYDDTYTKVMNWYNAVRALENAGETYYPPVDLPGTNLPDKEVTQCGTEEQLDLALSEPPTSTYTQEEVDRKLERMAQTLHGEVENLRTHIRGLEAELRSLKNDNMELARSLLSVQRKLL